jgi:leucyl-tRNA synthetase
MNIKIIEDINFFTNQSIKKITDNLENFHYNVIIANLHEIYNFYNKLLNEENLETEIFKINYVKILKVIHPILPHLISECLADLNEEPKVVWPEVIEKYLTEDTVTIVVQINGKKRATIECKRDITEKNIIDLVKNKSETNKYLENKQIIKNIYVKNKIINFIVK